MDLIRFFHNIIMIGSISKYAWAHGLHDFLQKLTRQSLPEFKKPWEYAYFNWLELDRICQLDCTEELERMSGAVFKQNTLASLCPACFYRSYDDDLPCVFSVDGNFQHSRRKWISTSRESNYTPELFITESSTEDEVDSQPRKNLGGCNHTFATASAERKPKSMANLDETGVMGAVCRHSIPLRYLNLFAGERSSSTVSLIKSVVDMCPTNAAIHVQYDIACKFERSLQFADPVLHKRVQLSLNAFHNYSHELCCQLLWGPLRVKGLGRSDGEGCERDWASMAHLVSVGRQSSAKSRIILLDQHGLYQARRLRVKLFSNLQKRFDKCHQELQESSRVIEDLVLSIKEQSEQVTREAVLTELSREAQAQRSWFMATEACFDDYLDQRPFNDVYQCIRRERELEIELRKSFDRFTLRRAESTDCWMPTIENLESQYAQAVSATDEALGQNNQCRADWAIEGQLWATYSSFDTWNRLEKLKSTIHQQISARAVELKSIRSRITGHKGAQKLVQSLKRRLPRIKVKVDEFNKLCVSLPEYCRPQLIDKDTFDLDNLEKSCNLPLWEFESCRASSVGKATTWKYSAKMISSVEALYRQDRATEELQYLKNEIQRTLDWTESQLSELLSILPRLSQPSFRSRALDLIMDLLEMSKGPITKKGDSFYGRPLITLRSMSFSHVTYRMTEDSRAC